MANREQLEILKNGVNNWNRYIDSYSSYPNIELGGVNLSNLDLDLINLRNADLRQVDFKQSSISEADLSGSNLSGADLTEVNFSNSSLVGVKFNNSILVDVDFSYADLSSADFTGANITDANFENANLLDTKITIEQLKTAENIPKNYIQVINKNVSVRRIEEELEKAKKDLEKANENGKISSEENKRYQKIIDELQSKINQFEDSQTKFISKLDEATNTITKPYEYLDIEIKHENWQYWFFIIVAVFTFLIGTFYGISYQSKLDWGLFR